MTTRSEHAAPADLSTPVADATPLAPGVSAPDAASTRDDYLARIVEVVQDTLKVEPERLRLESRFTDDLGADSLDRLSLLMELEDKFSTTIPDEDAKTLTTVGAVLDYIEARLART